MLLPLRLVTRPVLSSPAFRLLATARRALLELDGRDIRREPWSDRHWKLARLAAPVTASSYPIGGRVLGPRTPSAKGL
jgi:hypothetical protein